MLWTELGYSQKPVAMSARVSLPSLSYLWLEKCTYPFEQQKNFRLVSQKKRPKNFEVIIEKTDGSQQKIKIPASKYPKIYPVLYLPPPGILSGAELSEMSPEMNVSILGNQEDMNALAAEYPYIAKKFPQKITIRWSDFFRMLAKIAHALTVGHCGTVGYTQFLPSLMLGSYPYLSNYMGGKTEKT
jgi:hypothetical protein